MTKVYATGGPPSSESRRSSEQCRRRAWIRGMLLTINGVLQRPVLTGTDLIGTRKIAFVTFDGVCSGMVLRKRGSTNDCCFNISGALVTLISTSGEETY